MTTLKKVLGRSKAGPCEIYLRLTHERKYKDIGLNLYCQREHFKNGEVSNKDPLHTEINIQLSERLTKARRVLVEYSGEYVSIHDLKAAIEAQIGIQGKSPLLKKFSDGIAKKLRENKQGGTASMLERGIDKFIEWNKSDIMLHKLNSSLLMKYKEHLQAKGLKKNSIATYMNSLRKVWKASEHQFVKGQSPFTSGMIPTMKRGKKKSGGTEIVHKLLKAEMENTGIKREAIQSRLLQVYMQGVDIIDLARMRKSAIKNGYIEVSRFKNRNKDATSSVKILLHPKTLEIINAHDSDCFLKSFDDPDADPDNNELFDKFRNRINGRVLLAMKATGHTEPLGSKAMRHTWPTLAHELGGSRVTISAAIAHASDNETEGYILVPQKEIDELNAKVIAHIHATKPQ